MSSDLRDHPVTYFAMPLLEGFDRDRVEVFCYSFYERERDRMQAHIEQQVTGFRWWPRKPSAEVAAGIAEDRLDILFELGGTTAMNKLDVMAHRPARISASWLGYPHSAGLEAIDYHPGRSLHHAVRPAAADRAPLRDAGELGGAEPDRLPRRADRGRACRRNGAAT